VTTFALGAVMIHLAAALQAVPGDELQFVDKLVSAAPSSKPATR